MDNALLHAALESAFNAESVAEKDYKRRKEISDTLFKSKPKTLDPIFLERIWKPDIYIGKYILENDQKVVMEQFMFAI